MCGIRQAHYSRIESGKRTPSVQLAKKLGEILKINWYELFD